MPLCCLKALLWEIKYSIKFIKIYLGYVYCSRYSWSVTFYTPGWPSVVPNKSQTRYLWFLFEGYTVWKSQPPKAASKISWGKGIFLSPSPQEVCPSISRDTAIVAISCCWTLELISKGKSQVTHSILWVICSMIYISKKSEIKWHTKTM